MDLVYLHGGRGRVGEAPGLRPDSDGHEKTELQAQTDGHGGFLPSSLPFHLLSQQIRSFSPAILFIHISFKYQPVCENKMQENWRISSET